MTTITRPDKGLCDPRRTHGPDTERRAGEPTRRFHEVGRQSDGALVPLVVVEGSTNRRAAGRGKADRLSPGAATGRQLERSTAMINLPPPSTASEDPGINEIVAEAISSHRTVRVGIDSGGYTAYVQLSEVVRSWDIQRITAAILKVATVAHDRYIVLTDASGTSSLTAAEVAAAELELDF